MSDVQMTGKTIAELGKGLVSIGMKPEDLIPELRTQDGWDTARFWFVIRGPEASMITCGHVDHIFTSLDDVRSQMALARIPELELTERPACTTTRATPYAGIRQGIGHQIPKGQMRGSMDMGRLWTWCDRCTPVVRVKFPSRKRK